VTAKRPPAGLAAAGVRLWRDVIGAYELDPGEVALLLAACRTTDELVRVESELAAGDLMVEGSRKQPVPNPLLATARAHRKTLESLLRSLALPIAGEQVGRVRSPQARDAARAKWRRSGLTTVRGRSSDGSA
jgi:hypothetical protein